MPRSRTGSRPGGKKAARRIDTEQLEWALSDFSGFIAVDELHDGPFCILSIVDNRTFKRLSYQVLDHDPTHTDITALFRRFRAALDTRGLTVCGITTDGSPLYPEPIAAVFGEVPHQGNRGRQPETRRVCKATRLSAQATAGSEWRPESPRGGLRESNSS
jgi:hypothetical protein